MQDYPWRLRSTNTKTTRTFSCSPPPRGGVPVGAVIAHQLHSSLDVLVVRKLGVPGHNELAMGAIARGGIRVLPPLKGLQRTGVR
jgi:predicted phosphoribosyltransferase